MHFNLGEITCRDVVTLDTSISFFSSRPWTREKNVEIKTNDSIRMDGGEN